MGLKDTQIELDNPWNTYYAGQTINGQVTYTFDSPKKIRGVVIRFLGEANTKWTETKTVKDNDGRSHTETETLTGHEEYFQTQYYLIGGKNSSEIDLPAGQHKYPFTCTLPPTLPSSFEGEWGHVRYTVKLTLDRPWKFDQESKMAFTVITPVDLNQNPRIKEPFTLELEKSFCCFCCRSGPLCAIVKLPVTGYVSGQIIPVSAEVDNLSNIKVDDLVLVLRKIVKFYTNHPRRDIKSQKVDLAEMKFGPVEAHDSQTWQKQFQIPTLPPSNLINCGLIDLDYEIKVELEVEGFHNNLDGKIPIVLGTIPLVNFESPAPYTDTPIAVQQPQQDLSMIPTHPVSPASPPSYAMNGAGGALGWSIGDPKANFPNMPPPQFSECQFKGNIVDQHDSEHTKMIGAVDFAPRYPTYAPNASAPNI